MSRLRAVALLSVVLTACGSLAATEPQATPAFEPLTPPSTSSTLPASTTSTSTTTTIAAPTPADARAVITPSGVVLPVRAFDAGTWTVATPCANEVTVTAMDFVGAVDIVIDPGHGGAAEPGAAGSTGLSEAAVNLEVATRLERWLAERGISSVLTRYADYRLPIVTRAEIATTMQPLAFVSIHHNGGAGLAPWPEPATEIYVQFDDPDALRLGELLYEELLRALTPYDAAWLGSGNAGVRYRLDGEGTDYYGVLRRSAGVVSVITEALFLTNPEEEALLLDPAVLDAEAEAIGTAILRYLGTDETGYGFVGGDTITSSGSGTGGTAGCEDPAFE